MKTRSKSRRLAKTNQESGKTVSTQTEQFESEKKSAEKAAEIGSEILEAMTKKLLISNLNAINVLSESQIELRSLNISEKTMVVNKEGNQNEQFVLPVNIHLDVSPPKSVNSSVSRIIQPIVLQFNESNDTERMSSQENVVKRAQESLERRVENFISVSSTDSRNAPFHFSECSNIVSVKENTYISSNQNCIRQGNNTDVDVSELPDTSSNEISSEQLMTKVTKKKRPAHQVVNVKERTSKNRQKHATKKSNADLDKDFVSVTPKLQNKLRNLIQKQIEKVNTSSYKNAKKKKMPPNYKHLVKYHKERLHFNQSHFNTSKEPEQVIELDKPDEPDEPGVMSTDHIPEVIVLSDSDTPTEKSNKKEEVKGIKKRKRTKNVKRTKKQKDVDSKKDVPLKDGKRKCKERNVTLQKQETVRAREPRDQETCKKPSKEQPLNWVQKVAFAKVCQLQPKVFSEKEILLNSQVERTVCKDKEQDDSLLYCETPQRTKMSYQNLHECLSREVSGVESSPEAPGSSNPKQANEEQVVAIENERNEDICNSKKAQKSEIRLEAKLGVGGLASDESNDEIQQNDILVRGETSETSDTYQLPNEKQASEDQVLASENKRNDEICTSAVTSKRKENVESSNNERYLTLLAESCNFSQILQKFREKHYQDKVQKFFPQRKESNNDHILQNSSSVAKESPLDRDEPEKRSVSGYESSVQTVKRKKKKDKCEKFGNDNNADENLNPSSLDEPEKCLLGPTEKPLQWTPAPVSPQEKESLNETSMSANRPPFIPMLTNIQSNNEKNLNCDDDNVPINENFEKISDGINVKESWDSSSLSGNTAPEKNVILQEGHDKTSVGVNQFREIKKKFRLLSGNLFPRHDLETNNVFQSSTSHLDPSRKILSNMCMAQNTSDIEQSEKTDIKRKRSRKSSANKSVSSGKKMKQPNKNDENSNTPKSSNVRIFTKDDYTPLNASGPTKFAVAPLDKVTPYREHAAKDFKTNMLYGDRVKRFKSSKSLKIYKSKQNSSRKKSSY